MKKLLKIPLTDLINSIISGLTFLRIKKDEYLLINFDDLIDKREILIKILNFFEIPIDKKNIDEALKFNTKDFTRSHLKFEFKGTRFTNEKKKIK